MKSKILLIILCFLTFGIQQTMAQSKLGITELSVSAFNIQNGVPFVRFAPLHPGLEIGATFLEKDKEKSGYKIGAELGYFHHDLLANAFYLKASYTYQLKIKQSIGISAYGGLGYAHIFYPGDGYKFDAESGKYESAQVNQGFLASNIGVKISYLKTDKVKPFIKYETMFLGFDPSNLLTNLHIGFNINLNK